MDGFKTARALVLDDKLDDAMPVIRALGLLGIGAVYNDGSADAVYERRLTGVRVMFVDMVLEAHGADSNDTQACTKMVAETLSRLVEDSCDPIIVVCWTGHETMAPEFQAVLRKVFPKSKIDEVIVATKSQYNRPEDLMKLKLLISTALAAQSPVNILFRWEQMVHDAATQTTGALTQLIQQFGEANPATWNQYGFQVCAALARAERGSRLVDENAAFTTKALFSALNPLLSDRLDHADVPSEPELSALAITLKDNVKAQKQSALTPQLRAALNSMVHLSSKVAQSELCPGDLFFAEGRNSDLTGHAFPDWEDVRKDTFNSANPAGVRLPLPLVMEISAICDFAQAKTRMPRFIAGFLVPETAMGNCKQKCNYIKPLGPLVLNRDRGIRLDGLYSLVFNVHYLFGIRRDIANNLVPIRRLRAPILSEFTAWINGQTTRPGPLHFGP